MCLYIYVVYCIYSILSVYIYMAYCINCRCVCVCIYIYIHTDTNMYFLLKKYFIHSFIHSFIHLSLERAREGESKGEKHHCVVASWAPPTGDLAHNPGMWPDWESNWQPFGLQACAQSTEPHQPGHFSLIMVKQKHYGEELIAVCFCIPLSFDSLVLA